MPEGELVYPNVFGLPVWYELSRWHETMGDIQTTQPKVRQLIERVATKHGRWRRLGEIDENHEHPNVRLTVQDGVLKDVQMTVRGSRAETLSWAIHGAVRHYKRRMGALLIRQRDVTLRDGGRQRRIILSRDHQKKSTAQQLQSLDAALRSTSAYKIEAAYWGLTPPTLELVRAAVAVAGSRGLLATYGATGIVTAHLQTQQMDDPELLRLILPVAREAIPRPGVHTARPRDDLLRVILEAYRAASGSTTTSARRGGIDAPFGAGADFVCEIAAIFGVYLMPAASTHAIRRAMRR